MDFSFCIGLIPEQLFNDVRLLNKLRNLCAHGSSDFRITDQIVSRFIEPMVVRKVIVIYFKACDPPQTDWASTPRQKIGTLAALGTLTNSYTPSPKQTIATEQQPNHSQDPGELKS